MIDLLVQMLQKKLRTATYEMKCNKGPQKSPCKGRACISLFDEAECTYHSWHGVWGEDFGVGTE